MPVKVQDIYQQKVEIEKNKFDPKEAYIRLLISRGYYASFLYARSLFKPNTSYELKLITEDANGKSFGSHQKIYESLIYSDIKNLSEIGYKLRKYHKLRKKSDYELSEYIKDYDLVLAEQYFKECKNRIDSFLFNELAP